MTRKIALILFFALTPFALAGALTNVPYTFANGQYVDANAMNSNFSAICTDTLNIWSAQGASNAWANNGLLAVSNQNLGVSNWLQTGLLATSNQNIGVSNWLYAGLLAISNQVVTLQTSVTNLQAVTNQLQQQVTALYASNDVTAQPSKNLA
jgi:hypothetical protein